MTLKDFYPFTKTLSDWCLEKPDLARFTLSVDDITVSLIVGLEWQFGQNVCRVNQMFSYLQISLVRDQKYLIDILESKTKQVRAEIHGV